MWLTVDGSDKLIRSAIELADKLNRECPTDQVDLARVRTPPINGEHG